MCQINNLKFFLKSIKETLPFDDENDFKQKITGNKDFRIKVQKLVYLSKFFGWNNTYHFNFHERGPYSIELTEDYKNLFEPYKSHPNAFNFKIGSFKEFVENQNNEFLEASSTILYYISKTNIDSIDKKTMLEIISYLKPHIPKETVDDAWEKINENDLLNNTTMKTQKTFPTKEMTIDKINGLISIFENFEKCSNRLLLLGSLDYFKLALKKENLKSPQKNKLLNSVYDYAEFIENYYFENYKINDNFVYCDLEEINSKFDKLQDYISDLKVLPKVYDEDVDLTIFCE